MVKNSTARLEELCREGLSRRRLILASNRGPIEYQFSPEGQLQAQRGSGGVVTALTGLSKYIDICWIASAMGEGDREAARRVREEGARLAPLGEGLYLHFVVNPRSTYHKFYGVFCNPLLWFLQHYMWNSPRTPNIDHAVHDAWENGYVPVNQAFARAVVDEAKRSELPPIVMLNDYHLYLVSANIRQQLPDVLIQHFIHIPWPSPRYWQLLPTAMRQAIHESLCTTDIVGLQTQRDVLSFLQCCHTFIERAEINYKQQTVTINDHVVMVKAYPTSVDVLGLRKIVASVRCQEYEEKLSRLCGEQTIIRVDRCEPSKNIIRGFRAFDALLERYPQFRGKVKFITFLVPTRTHIKTYQRYAEESLEIIGAINNKYRTENWYPIDLFYENNYVQAIAGMRLYDVMLVNVVIDGMNLVAKEGPTVNSRDGVLILSEGAGACEQLGHNALTVTPTDLEGTTQALYTALTMPLAERRRRAVELKRMIEEEDMTSWLRNLLGDMVTLIQERSGITTGGSVPHQLRRSG